MLLQHAELARELSGRLYFFWQLRSYSQGCQWLRQALQLGLPVESDVQKINQARALYGLGCLAYLLSEYAEAKQALEQALVLRHSLGDIRSQATLLKGFPRPNCRPTGPIGAGRAVVARRLHARRID